MRVLSEMIIFVAVCLLMVSVMYGVQHAFFADGASVEGGHWQSRTPAQVPLHNSKFPSHDRELPSAPAQPLRPKLVPAPFPPGPAAPGIEDFYDTGHPLLRAKSHKL